MFRKVVQTNCMKRRVVKYYTTIPMTIDTIQRFEKYGKLEVFPLLKTYKINVEHQYLIQGIIDGYQFSVSYKDDHWQNCEKQIDNDLQIVPCENHVEQIYLDYNATTPVDARVLQKMIPFLQNLYANPSSAHKEANKVQNAIEKARHQVAMLIDCEPQQLLFTSGGTESINHAIVGVAWRQKFFCDIPKRDKILTTKTEHSATLQSCEFLKKVGFQIEYLPTDINGIVQPEALKKMLDNNCLLVSLAYVNNETGTIQPIEKIAHILANSSTLFHVDAVQALGKIPISVTNMNIDLLSLSAHKIYGAKGVGALYLKENISISPILWGGSQENHLRAGTPNVPGIIGMGEACQIALREMDQNSCHLHTMRKEFLKLLSQKNIKFILNTDVNVCLPSTLNICFPDIEGDTLMLMLEEKGIIVSRGSACNSHSQKASSVLLAIGISELQARNSLRFSFGKYTSIYEIDTCINNIFTILESLRNGEK